MAGAAVRAGLAGLAALALAGCGSGGITAPRLEGSVAGTFARLYVLQQERVGQPAPDAAALQAAARCQRGSPSSRQTGAGNDWICQVTFLAGGPQPPTRALYSLDVHPDGCWSADGDGPPAVNGLRTLSSPDGRLRVNPLYLVDGCFDGA